MPKLASTLFALAVLLAGGLAAADRFEPYDKARFDALQEAGTPLLLDVWADWCPTCKRQHAVLAELLAEPEFAELVAVRLDWDADRDTARALGAPRQSTLILYRGRVRVAISVAETDSARLRQFLRQLGG